MGKESRLSGIEVSIIVMILVCIAGFTLLSYKPVKGIEGEGGLRNAVVNAGKGIKSIAQDIAED